MTVPRRSKKVRIPPIIPIPPNDFTSSLDIGIYKTLKHFYYWGSIKLEKWLSFTTSAVYNEFTRTRSRNTLLTFGLNVQR